MDCEAKNREKELQRHALLIEMSEGYGFIVKDVLERTAWNVVLCRDFQVALKTIVFEQTFDLALVNIERGEDEILSFCRLLTEISPQTSLVLFSRYGEAFTRVADYDVKATACLKKPFGFEVLFKILEGLKSEA